MAELLRMSEATALALHTMAMVAGSDEPLSAAPMAQKLCASEAHVFKVLQQLVRSGLLRSKRGPSGGYVLARPAAEIALMEVYEVFEGSMRTDGCLFDARSCNELDCILGTLVEDVRSKVVNYFASTTLAQVGEK